MEKELKQQLDELIKLQKKEDTNQKTNLDFEERLQTMYEINKVISKKQRESMMKLGISPSDKEKQVRRKALMKIIGGDMNGLSKFEITKKEGFFSRKDFEFIPKKDITSIFGIENPICQCGESSIYIQPEWADYILGPYLDYWLAGDGKDHIYDWNDVPPKQPSVPYSLSNTSRWGFPHCNRTDPH